jgi:hypothetical protein
LITSTLKSYFEKKFIMILHTFDLGFFLQAAEAGDEFDALQAPPPFIRTKDGRFPNEIVTFLMRLSFLNKTIDGRFPNEIVTFLKILSFPNDTVTFLLKRSLSH